MFLNILRLTTKITGSFVEDMFENSPDVILRDDVLEEFLGKGCGGTKDGVENGIEKCLGHYGVGLSGFVMEEFFHRRGNNKNNVFKGINMVEVR